MRIECYLTVTTAENHGMNEVELRRLEVTIGDKTCLIEQRAQLYRRWLLVANHGI